MYNSNVDYYNPVDILDKVHTAAANISELKFQISEVFDGTSVTDKMVITYAEKEIYSLSRALYEVCSDATLMLKLTARDTKDRTRLAGQAQRHMEKVHDTYEKLINSLEDALKERKGS